MFRSIAKRQISLSMGARSLSSVTILFFEAEEGNAARRENKRVWKNPSGFSSTLDPLKCAWHSKELRLSISATIALFSRQLKGPPALRMEGRVRVSSPSNTPPCRDFRRYLRSPYISYAHISKLSASSLKIPKIVKSFEIIEECQEPEMVRIEKRRSAPLQGRSRKWNNSSLNTPATIRPSVLPSEEDEVSTEASFSAGLVMSWIKLHSLLYLGFTKLQLGLQKPQKPGQG